MSTTMRAETGAAQTLLAEQVVRLRLWMHLLNEDLKRKAFTIPVHLAFGHEAIAVAIGSTMTADDRLVLTHRNVAYNLVRAGDLGPVRDEFLGLPSGLAGGHLGSMNLTNPARGVMYTSSILGNDLAVACGLALGKTVISAPGVVIALTGDGAIEEGTFWESLVFAKTHALPLLVVIEDNDQSMSSTIAQRRTPIAMDRVCAGVGVPFSRLVGNDVFAYRDHIASLREDMSREPGPRCLEVRLAALNQHAGPTPGWPTDPKRIDLADGLIVKESDVDPVFVLRGRLGEAEVRAIEARVRAEAP